MLDVVGLLQISRKTAQHEGLLSEFTNSRLPAGRILQFSQIILIEKEAFGKPCLNFHNLSPWPVYKFAY